MDKPNDPTRKAQFLLVFGLILILVGPWLFTYPANIVDFSKTGSIGDTIGGITAPIVNFLGAILVYLALKAQVEANSLVWQQRNSDKDKELEDREFDRVLLLSGETRIIQRRK